MLYMVIEYFNAGAAVDIYRRARDRGSIAIAESGLLWLMQIGNRPSELDLRQTHLSFL